MSQDVQAEFIALRLHEIGAVRLGQFTLHSGLTSPIYIDLRLLASHPQLLRQTAVAYKRALHKLEFELLSAAPLAGLPIGTAVSLEMDKPLVYPRLTPKNYGTGKRIEGQWSRGQTAVVIDDLITSGGSLLQTARALEEEGLKVEDLCVLIDREQGGKELVESAGYRLHRIMTISHLLDYLESNGRISSQEKAQIADALSSRHPP